MKIKYRFTFLWEEARALQLKALGLTVIRPPAERPKTARIAVSHVIEGVPGWKEAYRLVQQWDGWTTVTTEFTAAEISCADYCCLRVVYPSDCPRLQDDSGHREQACDTSAYCAKCGAGAKQVAPFQVRRSLKWGRDTFLKLFWVEDAYFTRTPVWRKHLAPLGVGSWPVEDTSGSKLEDIVQLRCEAPVPLAMRGVCGTRCGTCGRERYPWHDRGFFPAPAGRLDLPIFRSKQYFGAGSQSSNAIIVSSKVVKAIQAAGMKGVELWPCAPSKRH